VKQFLQGRWCRLKPLDSEEHGDDLCEAVVGPDATRLHRHLADPTPASRADIDAWLVPKAASDDPMFFAVIDR
jgi:hypothetical protein